MSDDIDDFGDVGEFQAPGARKKAVQLTDAPRFIDIDEIGEILAEGNPENDEVAKTLLDWLEYSDHLAVVKVVSKVNKKLPGIMGNVIFNLTLANESDDEIGIQIMLEDGDDLISVIQAAARGDVSSKNELHAYIEEIVLQ